MGAKTIGFGTSSWVARVRHPWHAARWADTESWPSSNHCLAHGCYVPRANQKIRLGQAGRFDHGVKRLNPGGRWGVVWVAGELATEWKILEQDWSLVLIAI